MYSNISSKEFKELTKILGYEDCCDIQDWDLAWADKLRVQEFIDLFVNYSFTTPQKQELACLILASLDEAHDLKEFDLLGEKTRRLLLENQDILSKITNYWAAEHRENPSWRITPMCREVLAERESGKSL